MLCDFFRSRAIPAAALLLSSSVCWANSQNSKEVQNQKLAEDPTKVVTQVGFGYTDELKISGSLSLDPVKKINASVNHDASEWRVGGSWLFDLGILNFSFSKKEFDTGNDQTSYSVGTFIPLSAFGIEPYGWQIFPMAGLSYNEGNTVCEVSSGQCGTVDPFGQDFVTLATTSTGAYLGAFSIKPLSDKWTLLAFAVGSVGTDSYSGHFLGAGVGYRFTQQQSVSTYAYTQDNTYGTDSQLGLAYRYQFE